jgi:hypothetical protein
VKKNYQRKERKSNHKFEVVRGQELLVRVPLPMAEVWAEMQQFPFAWEFFYPFGRAAIRLDSELAPARRRLVRLPHPASNQQNPCQSTISGDK